LPPGAAVYELRRVTVDCPQCGGHAEIPDGIYDLSRRVITLLGSRQLTMDQLSRLAASLEEGLATETDSAGVADLIEKDLPELRSLRDVLPQTRSELYTVIKILMAAIGLIIAGMKVDWSSHQSVDNLIDNAVQGEPRVQGPAVVQPVGRNDPCPCGSGKKFKKCCMLNR
jgi:uncharacterized protein YecA (UPF0149 family)